MSKRPLKFATDQGKEFAQALTANVNQYFKDNNIAKTANGLMIFKTVFHLSLWIGSYLLLLLGGFDHQINYAIWAVLGFAFIMVTVNIGHDAIHGSYSDKKWVNQLLSHTFNLNGASAYMWTKMHNTAHHTYPNVDGYDEDIESLPIIRMSPKKKLKPVHRFQHIYSFFFYGLATLSWVLVKDYVKFFKNDVGNFSGQKHAKKEYFYLFFYKIINYTLFFILPMIFIPNPWWHILLGFLLMHFVAGFSVAIIFMLAHIVEETHFPIADENGQLKNSWHIHQFYTTANFARKSRLAGFLTGGLNLQVEHHIFSNICSIHYRSISGIVKHTAEQYGVPYFEASFPRAIWSHINFLRKMGKYEDYKPYTAAA